VFWYVNVTVMVWPARTWALPEYDMDLDLQVRLRQHRDVEVFRVRRRVGQDAGGVLLAARDRAVDLERSDTMDVAKVTVNTCDAFPPPAIEAIAAGLSEVTPVIPVEVQRAVHVRCVAEPPERCFA